MKKAINIWSFPVAWDLPRILAIAAEAGFVGFEPALGETGPIRLDSQPGELREVRQMADKEGLKLCSLATGLYWQANAASEDSSVRERAARILGRQIECAAELGVDTVLVIPGSVGADFVPGAEEIPYDIAYARARAFIEAALPMAARNGVRLAIENVWNKFLLSPLEMRDFIDSFGTPWVGSYLDVGNVLATGFPEHWISILGSRIQRLHFKDFRRSVGTIHGFVDLLAGDANWPAIVNALSATRYEGWVTAEMIPPAPFYRHHSEVLIRNTSAALDSILQGCASPPLKRSPGRPAPAA